MGSGPYRDQADVQETVTAPSVKPTWRIVKRATRQGENFISHPYKWLLQRRILWFWWTVDWHYGLSLCLELYDRRTTKSVKPKVEPDVVVWDDVNSDVNTE